MPEGVVALAEALFVTISQEQHCRCHIRLLVAFNGFLRHYRLWISRPAMRRTGRGALHIAQRLGPLMVGALSLAKTAGGKLPSALFGLMVL